MYTNGPKIVYYFLIVLSLWCWHPPTAQCEAVPAKTVWQQQKVVKKQKKKLRKKRPQKMQWQILIVLIFVMLAIVVVGLVLFIVGLSLQITWMWIVGLVLMCLLLIPLMISWINGLASRNRQKVEKK